MRILLMFLLFTVPFLGHGESFFAQSDKHAHMAAGYAIGLTCNVALSQWGVSEIHRPGEPARPAARAWMCTLFSFVAGGLFEYAQVLDNKRPDLNDILATGIGGGAAGLFTIAIDF